MAHLLRRYHGDVGPWNLVWRDGEVVGLMVDLASRGRPRQQQMIADGELERERRAVIWGEGHRRKFEARTRRPSRAAT